MNTGPSAMIVIPLPLSAFLWILPAPGLQNGQSTLPDIPGLRPDRGKRVNGPVVRFLTSSTTQLRFYPLLGGRSPNSIHADDIALSVRVDLIIGTWFRLNSLFLPILNDFF